MRPCAGMKERIYFVYIMAIPEMVDAVVKEVTAKEKAADQEWSFHECTSR